MPIIVKKKYGYTASVDQGSNKIIACSKANWAAVRDGSFITIDADEVFYKVISKKKFIYKKDVTVLNQSQLKLNTNAGALLSVDDDISFTCNEYYVSLVTIAQGGQGYEAGDIITPQGGICKYNSIDEIDIPAQITVDEVGENGEILSLSLTTAGAYTVPPLANCGVVSDLGEGASINVTCKASDLLTVEDRTITLIEHESNHTILHLNHPLPPKSGNGEIKTEKWELTINIDYPTASKYSVNYEITKDFTPHNDIPLIHGDMSSSHLVYNEAMAIIDQRLKDLES